MKLFDEIKIPATTQKRLIAVTCDLCGFKGKPHWDGGLYEVNTTTLKVVAQHTEGTQYPEGGDGEAINIDLCPKCFRERLVPWLKSEGANIKYEEWDR